MEIDAKLGLDVFKLDKEPHIVVKNEICSTVCVNRACLYVCPPTCTSSTTSTGSSSTGRGAWSAAPASSAATLAPWSGRTRAASSACSTA